MPSTTIEQQLATLHAHYTGQVNAAVAAGRMDLAQDLAIDRLGLGQSAGLVMPDGHPHRLLDRELRHEPLRIIRVTPGAASQHPGG